MHYSGFYESANGQATIIDNANGQPFQANEFLPSSMDIYQICMAYGCNKCAGLDIAYYDGQGKGFSNFSSNPNWSLIIRNITSAVSRAGLSSH